MDKHAPQRALHRLGHSIEKEAVERSQNTMWHSGHAVRGKIVVVRKEVYDLVYGHHRHGDWAAKSVAKRRKELLELPSCPRLSVEIMIVTG